MTRRCVRAAGREAPPIIREIVRGLQPLYMTPEETREQGYILTEHFGWRLPGRPGRIDLTGVSQRWLRDLLWDHFAGVFRSPRCPRSARTFDDMRRAVLELSAFLEVRAPGGGHDPAVLTAQHMHQFAADQRQRERRRPAVAGVPGTSRQAVDRDRQHPAGGVPPHPAAVPRGAGIRRGRAVATTASSWIWPVFRDGNEPSATGNGLCNDVACSVR